MNSKNEKVKLLAGGNPQIPKGVGDGPVQDYIGTMPGWKQGIGEQVDDLIEQTVPQVHKAVLHNIIHLNVNLSTCKKSERHSVGY